MTYHHSDVARDAAVIYLAINGWEKEMRCEHLLDPDVDEPQRCGREMAGVSADSAAPLCDEHVDHPEEIGHRLTPEVLAAIRVERERQREEAAEAKHVVEEIVGHHFEDE